MQALVISTLFVDPKLHRLRAIWRLLVHTLLMVVLGFATIVATQAATLPEGAFWPVFALAVTLPATWIAATRLDRRPFASLGLNFDRRWWLDLAFGLALGAGLMTAIFAVELAAGWVTITGTKVAPEGFEGPFVASLLGPAILFVAVGFHEELLSRGYHLRNFAEGMHWPGKLDAGAALIAGTILSSLVFGLLHAGNPNATWLSNLNIALAGGFLAVGLLTTGELAIPIGVHITWNFCQGNLFGFPVSGTNAGARVIAIEQGGDPLITGGQFGPEAGLIGVAAMLVGSLAIVAWVRWTRGAVGLRRELILR